MSTVYSSYHAFPRVPLLLHQDKFVEAARLFGYRVVHVPYDPCPEGSGGCVLCKGDRPGFHRREPLQLDVVDTLRYHRADGLPETLSHRFRTAPLSLLAPVGGVMIQLEEGVDFRIQNGRTVKWMGRTPDYQKEYTVSYRALAESWVHMQHAYGDFGGLKRKSEMEQFVKMGVVPQGSVLMSINHDNPGYDLMPGDVFVAVDGQLRTGRHIVAGRNSNRSMHRFVHEVERAYGVDEESRVEFPVSVSYDPATLEFTVADNLADDTRVAVVYRAAPQYFVYLDVGEFRHPLGQDHQRLVVLSKLETSA